MMFFGKEMDGWGRRSVPAQPEGYTWVRLLMAVVLLGQWVAVADLPFEPAGPSSRRTGLAITEVMYHPAARADGKLLEFVEVFNSQAIAEDLSGYRLAGDVDYTFPAGTTLAAGAYIVVAQSPNDLKAVYGIVNVVGPFTNSLPNTSGSVRLKNEMGGVILDIAYETKSPWPVGADGSGHSLVLARGSYGEGDPRAWAMSDAFGGSPGKRDPITVDPLAGVLINEFLAHTDSPLEDYVELYNHSNMAKDLSGAWLSDDVTTNKFRIPDGTTLEPRGFLFFTEGVLGFALSSGGERVVLVNSNQTRVIDAIDFEAQETGVATGRVPDGGGDFYRLAARTPGTNNTTWLASPVVINEIMYHPISGLDDDQYVELYNRTTSTVNLGGWRLTSGVDFIFPPNTQIAPNGYLVAAKNVARMLTNYPNLNAANCVGNFGGGLKHGGERLALAKPDATIVTNGTVVVTNFLYVVVSEVTYGDGGRWGDWSDGGGSSLEVVDANANIRLPDNWADSDESAKSAWTRIEYTGRIGETLNSPVSDNLHLYLLGVGECLIDDVRVLTNATDNLITNPGFESGLSGWTLHGAFDQSTAQGGGFSGTQSLWMRAAARGDVGANKIRSPSFASISSSATVTLSCQARWLRGWPELLLRLHGGGAEAGGKLQVPANLGTPGARNSRAVANNGPAIFNVRHTPVMPTASQSVVVTAQVDDPNGVSTLTLRRRADPATNFVETVMSDDGTGGDAVAGDGVFSATIPAQIAGTLIAFHIRAVDAVGVAGTFPRTLLPGTTPARLFPTDATSHECLIRFSETQMSGNFATYHYWLTKANRDRWANRDPLNNAEVDATFVYNNYRVIYNAGALFAGSPWHRGQMTTGPDGGNRCDYVLHLPDDDRLLGETDVNIALPGNGSGGNSSDLSGMSEQASFIIFRKLGVPSLHRRYIHLFLNGSQRSTVSGLGGNFVYEDVQQPNGAMLEEWFPDDPDGQLFKVEDWFEFNDAATSFSNNDADLTRRLIPGSTNLNLAPYRFMFRKRSISAGESANDYTNFFSLIEAVSPTTTSGAAINYPLVSDLADIEQWFRVFACQRTVGNWDSYGWERGKNAFLYKPTQGRFQMLVWDVDFTLGVGSRATDATLFGASDARIASMQNTPVIRRSYLQSFRDILDGPLKAGYLEAALDARAAAFTANGIAYDANVVATQKSYLAGRRTYLASQLAAATTNFSILSPTANTFTANLVTFAGTAPIELASIAINGEFYPLTWTTATTWSLTAALNSGTNVLNFVGYTRAGVALTNALATRTISVNRVNDSPVGSVVFNEVMYQPAVPNAGFLELNNVSATTAFDLKGWRISELDYTFPAGSVIVPGGYLVLARDRYAFAQSYGTSAGVLDEFSGTLGADAKTLSLVMPAAQAGQEIVVDQMRYEAAAPWAAASAGVSLQLVDSTQDNSRVANWAVTQGNTSPAPQWVYFSTTGTATSSRLYLYLQSAGEVYLDDIKFVAGSVPDVGANLLVNGNFESALGAEWNLTANFTSSTRSTAFKYSGNSSLRVVATAAGAGTGNAIYQDMTPALVTGQPYALSFWYLQSTNANLGQLTVRLSNSGVTATVNPVLSSAAKLAPVTPGAVNSVRGTLPAFPQLWLNEVQPENLNGPVDNAGEREPWVEIYNAGTNALSLNGLYLTDSYGSLVKWAFPASASIPAGGFVVVWCDGQTSQTTAAALHTDFRLTPGTGTVALVRLTNGAPQILDYLNYTGVPANWSYGSLPEGQPFNRDRIFVATPGTTNSLAPPPLSVFINEWMADNTITLADPSDNQFEDWFELYNPGPGTADLGGYFLTDTLANKFKFQIPNNGYYVIPPRGRLLVWADDEASQNSTNVADLHAAFKLDKAGEAIGLFAADGTLIDAVTFGAQTSDVSYGRSPDGGATIVRMVIPTPNATNMVPNAAPVLAAISTKTIAPGQTLRFTAIASDADGVSQSLSFSLDPGAPAGATINPTTGEFVWSVPLTSPSGLSIQTIRVTDNGQPPLSDAKSFSVMIQALPKIDQVEIASGNTIRIVFGTVVGQTYRIEAKQNLEDQTWSPLGVAVAGTGGSIVVTDDLSVQPQRFYRLVVQP